MRGLWDYVRFMMTCLLPWQGPKAGKGKDHGELGEYMWENGEESWREGIVERKIVLARVFA